MKKLLILHAWFATPNDHWYQWLKGELKNKGVSVYIPELKDKEKANLKDWEKCALSNVVIDKDTSIIGHSLGAVLGLKLIQDHEFKLNIFLTQPYCRLLLQFVIEIFPELF